MNLLENQEVASGPVSDSPSPISTAAITSGLSKIAPTEQYAIDFNDDTVYPCISFAMKGNDDVYFADGKPRAVVYEVEVEVYQKRIDGNIEEIHFEVSKAMKDRGYKQIFYDYIFNDEIRIFNHILRFEKTLEYKESEEK